MPQVGYPDWERVQRQGGDLVALSNVIITTPLVIPVVNVQQWDALRFQINSNGSSDSQTILIQWYDTATLSNLLSQQTFTAKAGDSFGIPVPCQGPYVQVTITPKNGTAIAPFKISFTGIRSTLTDYLMTPMSVPLVSDSHAYIASGGFAASPPIYYGAAIFHVAPQGFATGQVTIFRFDLATFANVIMYQWQSVLPTAPLTVTVSLPLCIVLVQINNGANAQTITTTLMPTP